MALEYPEDLRYQDSHEYVRLEGEIATIGLSTFAVEELGDIVFLELLETGDAVKQGESFGNVESVKVAEDLYSPVSGTVIDRNEALLETPEQLAEDPYGEGWLIKIRLDNPDDELSETLSAEEYRAVVEGE
ncbi:MAG: glycine cleavage system protein GcvH [Geitlerinemataceae cyanobacterium]